MTPTEVFSFSLLLKGGQRAKAILALLEDEKRAEVAAAIERYSALPPSNIRQLWSQQRKSEEHLQVQAAQEKFGFSEERLAPALVKWLVPGAR